MIAPVALDDLVRRRAANRCEYCRMHQSLQGVIFHIEHIMPISLGGLSEEQNLALACAGCKLSKSNRIEARDPLSKVVVPLFHPRRADWASHFRFDDTQLLGLTQSGRATISALDMNHERRRTIRQIEMLVGLFPPPTK